MTRSMTRRTTEIAKGSIADVAQREGISIAEAFMKAKKVVVVDVSGSMDTADSRMGRTRYDVACEELAKVQEQNPGAVAVVAFSDHAEICENGFPVYMGGGTDLQEALEFVVFADGTGIEFIVISDGQPDDARGALASAAKLSAKIDTVFVGNDNDEHAKAFLRELAGKHGGQAVDAAKASQLAAKVTLMLGAGK